MDVSLPLGRLADLAAKLLQLNAVCASHRRITGELRQSFCAFQLEFTNYSFGCARLHRDFKEAFRAHLADPADRPLETVDAAYGELEDFTETGMKKLCGDHAEYVQKYFWRSRRLDRPPRVGIHMVGDDDRIYPLIMLTTDGTEGGPKSVTDYSVFQKVVATGLPYLDNWVPRTAKRDADYRDGGLDLERIRRDYRLRRVQDARLLCRFRANVLRNVSHDPEWIQMQSAAAHYGAELYKSHLAVPVTYRGHAEKGRLDRSLIDVTQLRDDGRSILGFLLVDHPAAHYFDDQSSVSFENTDVNVMYLFADTLSLVFVTALTYTQGSTTVAEYRAYQPAASA